MRVVALRLWPAWGPWEGFHLTGGRGPPREPLAVVGGRAGPENLQFLTSSQDTDSVFM